MLERYLIVWLSLSSLAAYLWPPDIGFDPFRATSPYLSYLIAVTMLAIGWMLPREEVREVIRYWPTVLGGTFVQYASMPLLAYGMGRLFQLDELWMTGIVVAGCVPGAMASNVLTMVARGNISYSVSLTTMATLLSPLVVPFTLSLTLGKTIPFEQSRASLWLVATVVGPVVVGHLMGRIFTDYTQLAQRVGKVIANLTILWIIAVVVGINRDRLAHINVQLVSALLGLNVLGYLAGNLGGRAMRISPAMRRALTIEVGMQNAGLGTTLVLALFHGLPDYERAAIPTALYTFGCMFTGTLLARWWAGRSLETVPDASPKPSVSV